VKINTTPETGLLVIDKYTSTGLSLAELPLLANIQKYEHSRF